MREAKPVRIQLSRKKGWRMPPDTVSVARPGRWGNPCIVGNGNIRSNADAALAYREIVTLPEGSMYRVAMRVLLFDKNLACWCALCDAHKNGKQLGVECADCDPCHADVLLELANPVEGV